MLLNCPTFQEKTVNSAIIRLIAKIDINENDLIKVCKILKDLNKNDNK